MTTSFDYSSLSADRCEADVLDATRQECYRATSSRFRSLRPEDAMNSRREDAVYRPVIDEQRSAAGSAKPVWPCAAPFAVCLTHDVDNVAWHNPVMHLRRMGNQFSAALWQRDARALRGLRSTVVACGGALLRARRLDPLFCYERWLEMEAEVGARSTFLFLPDRYGQRHYSDGGYRYGDKIVFEGQSCSVAEMMREIHRRGWEVGLHASWRSFDSVDEMLRQKEQVQRAIDAPVISVRHHNLHFDIRRTPRVHHAAGLTVDSSLGFNDNIGFRYGTSLPWRLRDVRTDEELNVLELPLVIQEKCLIRAVAAGDKETALEWADRLARRVAAVGGVLTLLWHPETIRFALFVEVYRAVLASLQAQGAWFGTMSEVAEWWRKTQTA